MEITQKKNSNKHTFSFYDNHFNFAYEDKSGSGDTDINYADFPQKSSVLIEQNEWLRNIGYLWMILGGFVLGYSIYSGTPYSGREFWFLLGAGCVLWAHLSKVKYSIFKSEKGNIFIIQDKNHDEIIKELNKRKKAQLIKWYGDVNTDNELETEINKFRWLADQDVITKEECETKIAEAEMLHDKLGIDSPGPRLN